MSMDGKRKPGRPRRSERPDIPWGDIEKAYITGEIVRELDDGSFERTYPSIRDLAEKFGVQRSLIGYHSKRHNWPARRVDFQNELRTEIHQIRAKARALSLDEAMGILDAYLEKFRAAVETGHVRVDSAIQARHDRLRAQVAALTPELAGVPGDPGAES